MPQIHTSISSSAKNVFLRAEPLPRVAVAGVVGVKLVAGAEEEAGRVLLEVRVPRARRVILQEAAALPTSGQGTTANFACWTANY